LAKAKKNRRFNKRLFSLFPSSYDLPRFQGPQGNYEDISKVELLAAFSFFDPGSGGIDSLPVKLFKP
jgi:hypothetical protein